MVADGNVDTSSYRSVRCFLLMYRMLLISLVIQFPWSKEEPNQVRTALTTGAGPDDLSRIRARNALKILLDVHGDFGQR
jgi:hypothetical protein